MKYLLMGFAAGTLAVAAMPAQATDIAAAAQPATPAYGHASPIQPVANLDKDDRRKYKRGKGKYDNRGRYHEPRRISRSDRVWRGRDGKYYCKRDNGTTGLLIGAGVGGLAGNQVAGDGDKTLGTVLGAVAGGLLGRAIDRDDVKCR